MLIGYARVSTREQNLDLQVDALKRAGVEAKHIFTDVISGAADERKGLSDALSYLREGDTLVVWKLDRLGRSVRQLVGLVEDLAKDGINFKSLSDSIDTSSASGKFFFHVMSALSEMERDLIRERTRAGLDAARARGRTGGRRPKMTDAKIKSARALLRDGVQPKVVAEQLGVSISTLYKHLPGAKGV